MKSTANHHRSGKFAMLLAASLILSCDANNPIVQSLSSLSTFQIKIEALSLEVNVRLPGIEGDACKSLEGVRGACLELGVNGSNPISLSGEVTQFQDRGQGQACGQADLSASAELIEPEEIVSATLRLYNNTEPDCSDLTSILEGGTVLASTTQRSSTLENGTRKFETQLQVDGAANAFTLPSALMNHTATKLGNGNILIIGGETNEKQVSNKAFLFEASTRIMHEIPSRLMQARAAHTAKWIACPPNFECEATPLDGKVVIAGGYEYAIDSSKQALNSIEVFDPSTLSFSFLSDAEPIGTQVTLSQERYHTSMDIVGRSLVFFGGLSAPRTIIDSDKMVEIMNLIPPYAFNESVPEPSEPRVFHSTLVDTTDAGEIKLLTSQGRRSFDDSVDDDENISELWGLYTPTTDEYNEGSSNERMQNRERAAALALPAGSQPGTENCSAFIGGRLGQGQVHDSLLLWCANRPAPLHYEVWGDAAKNRMHLPLYDRGAVLMNLNQRLYLLAGGAMQSESPADASATSRSIELLVFDEDPRRGCFKALTRPDPIDPNRQLTVRLNVDRASATVTSINDNAALVVGGYRLSDNKHVPIDTFEIIEAPQVTSDCP